MTPQQYPSAGWSAVRRSGRVAVPPSPRLPAALIIALLSDIHANLEALNACLRHAAETGASRYVFLGDLVGYGADPERVVEIIAGYAAAGAIVIKGNHDEAIEKTPRYMND